MVLAKQVVDYPFAHGVDEATEIKLLDRSGFAAVLNGQFSKDGTIDKRAGYKAAYGAASGYRPSRLASFDDRLVAVVTPDALQVKTPYVGRYEKATGALSTAVLDPAPPAVLERTPIAREYVESMVAADVALCHGFLVYVYEQKTAGACKIKVVEAATGTVVSLLDVAGIWPQAVTSGDHVLVTYASTTKIWTLIYTFDATGITATVGVTSVITDRYNLSTSPYDVTAMSASAGLDRWAISYVVTGTTFQQVLEVRSDGSTSGAYGGAVAVARVACWEEQVGKHLFIAYVETATHDLYYAVVDSVTHASVLTPTLVASAIWDAGDSFPFTPICIGPYTHPSNGTLNAVIAWMDLVKANSPPESWVPATSSDPTYVDRQSRIRHKARTQWAELSTTAVLPFSTTNGFRLGIASKPFRWAGCTYQWCVDIYTDAYELVSLEDDTSKCAAAYLSAPWISGTFTTWYGFDGDFGHQLPANVTDDGAGIFHVALQVKTVNDEGPFLGAWSVDRFTLDFASTHLHATAQLGNMLYLGGGFIASSGGESTVEHGVMQAPFLHAVMTQPVYPTGKLSFSGADGANLIYGDNFILDDGRNPAVTFRFNDLPGVPFYAATSITSPTSRGSTGTHDTSAKYTLRLTLRPYAGVYAGTDTTCTIKLTTTSGAAQPIANILSDFQAQLAAAPWLGVTLTVEADGRWTFASNRSGYIQVGLDDGTDMSNDFFGWPAAHDASLTEQWQTNATAVAIGDALDPDVNYEITFPVGYGIPHEFYNPLQPTSATDAEIRDAVIAAVNQAKADGVLGITAATTGGADNNYAVAFSNDLTGDLGNVAIAIDFAGVDHTGTPTVISALATPFSKTGMSGGLAAANSFGGGVYSYLAVYEWVDDLGARCRSMLSAPVVADLSTYGPGCTMSLWLAPLILTNKKNTNNATGVQIAVYRTAANGTEFRRVPFPASSIANDVTSTDFIQLTDTYSDDALLAQEQIYTDATAGQELENHQLYGGAKYLIARGDRLFAAGGEDPRLVWYTKAFVPGQPPMWNPALFIDAGDTVTGIAALDDLALIFTRTRILALFGDGPDNTGSTGAFSLEPLITDSGCIEAHSLATFNAGVVYQGLRGMYLMSRGRETVFIGHKVEDTVQGATIVGATVVQKLGQVRWILRSPDPDTADSILVYDYVQNEFAVWTPNLQTGQLVAACVHDDAYLLASSASDTIHVESPDTWTDNGNWFGLSVTTGWINFAMVQGFKRLWRWILLGARSGAAGLSVRLARSYAPAKVDTITIAEADMPSGPMQIRRHVGNQKGDAWQFTITETEPAVVNGPGIQSLTALSFELGVKSGVKKRGYTPSQ